MEGALDWYLAVPLLLTALAVVLATVFVKLRAPEGDKAAEAAKAGEPQEAGASATADQEEEKKAGEGEAGLKDEEGEKSEGKKVLVEELGAGDREKEGAEEEAAAAAAARAAEAEKRSLPPELSAPLQAAAGAGEEDEEEEDSKEEDQDWENERLVVNEPDVDDAADEQISFKYSPGKLRGNQYKTMMTKEELEEEQRVQREQLAAIFRLMKENSETFGEMSEGDMKEQLKLYDM